MGKDIKIKKRPTKDEIVKGKIANALTSAAKNHIVATTDDLYDTNFLEYQDEINKRISTDIEVVKEKAEVLETDVDAVELDVSLLKEHVSDIDERHTYEKVIYESYIKNNAFVLTDEQRNEAYKLYKENKKN